MFILVLLYNNFHGNHLTQWNYPMFLNPYISFDAFKSPNPPPQQVTDPLICDYDWHIHDCLGISLLKSDIKPSV